MQSQKLSENIKYFLRYHLPPLIFMGLIWWWSSIPNLKLSDGEAEFFRRKAVHLAEYGLLWVLIYRSFVGKKWFSHIRDNAPKVILALCLATLYGALDEVHQMYVPTRTGMIRDVGIDFLGVLMTITGIFLYSTYQKSKNFTHKK